MEIHYRYCYPNYGIALTLSHPRYFMFGDSSVTRHLTYCTVSKLVLLQVSALIPAVRSLSSGFSELLFFCGMEPK
jgi:hypothetical protein